MYSVLYNNRYLRCRSRVGHASRIMCHNRLDLGIIEPFNEFIMSYSLSYER